jgi:hypothetical protein
MAAPNFWYTDIALNQAPYANNMGQVGAAQIGLTSTMTVQNQPLLEGPPDIVGTYTWTGNEVQFDIINIGIGRAGLMISPKVTVASGTTAPAATLTVAIGDNDLGLLSSLPVTNAAAATGALGGPNSLQAPVWVTGTPYVAGNVVLDAASSPSNQTYTCILAVTGSTAPHSDGTHWIANQVRYSASIDIHAASGNVAGSGGTQLYGGVASQVPQSITPGAVQVGFSANSLLNQPYILQNDCWIQAVILTQATIAAGAVSVFRIPTTAMNN